MDGNWALIVAAVVTAVGGILVAVLQQFKKENHTDHQVVIGLLHVLRKSQQRVEDKVERVDERLTDHLESHLSEGILDNRQRTKQNRTEGDSKVSL
jgi:hypothetical protein